MNKEDLIISYLQDMNQSMDELRHDVTDLKQDMSDLKEKVFGLEQDVSILKNDVSYLKEKVSGLEQDVYSLKSDVSGLKGNVSSLNLGMIAIKQEIVDLRQEMNGKIDMLDQKLDSVEIALDTEIDSVYHIALENKRNIEILLIPFNDRNGYMKEEVAKIPKLYEKVDQIEGVVGKHSREIRELQATLA